MQVKHFPRVVANMRDFESLHHNANCYQKSRKNLARHEAFLASDPTGTDQKQLHKAYKQQVHRNFKAHHKVTSCIPEIILQMWQEYFSAQDMQRVKQLCYSLRLWHD